MTHYLALTCGSMARSMYAAAAQAAAVITVHVMDQGLHNTPKKLRDHLQVTIDTVPTGQFDAILLAYGMCGNGTLGLKARHTPLVIPRAHDCITLYLGSRERYDAEFNRAPGTYWYSQDYLERNRGGDAVTLGATGSTYETYVEKYGQENADYLMNVLGAWRAHYDRAAFIETSTPNNAAYREQARAKAEDSGWRFDTLTGDNRMITLLASGNWPEAEFLIVPPGYQIVRSDPMTLIAAKEVDAHVTA